MKRILLSVILLFAMFTTTFAQFRMSEGSKKMATAMAVIENLYVDKVDDNKLAEDAVKSLLEKLDPHSTYISADEVKEMNEPLEGNFDGIGISFNMITDTLYVIEALAGGPSEKVGLRAGDKILYVDGTLIAGVKMSTKDVMSRLKGPKGTNVTVSVLRKGVSDLVDFKITRAKIPIYSIDAAYMMDKNTGYIRPIRFGATTTNEFREAVQKLKKQGMENLILDLRQNGGGYMAPAIDLADDFLDKGKLIVYTEGNTQPRRDELSTNKGVFENGKLAILIDEGSASASEILSGAVQDWDRGVIVGRRSFGKGLVQRPIPLPDESMIRLTVARYYTPSGRSIQKPYTKGDANAYAMDIAVRYRHGELLHQDSVHFPDSLKYKTLRNERIVYGGGGIMPDYFVPIDTTFYSKYYGALWDKGIVPRIAYGEVDQYREELLAKYPSANDFYKNYEVPDELLNKLIASGEKEKIEYDDVGFNKSKSVLKTQLKAYIARDVYDTETSAKVFNKDNEILNKAYEIIKDDKMYHNLLKGK
ncbi:MAG: S41 family peptidase [Prevotella sp.]|nr:S41 family peptidase [Prevotella sp.]